AYLTETSERLYELAVARVADEGDLVVVAHAAHHLEDRVFRLVDLLAAHRARRVEDDRDRPRRALLRSLDCVCGEAHLGEDRLRAAENFAVAQRELSVRSGP